MSVEQKFEAPDPDWDRKVRESFARQTFMKTIDGRISALTPGYCDIEIPFRPELCQQNGYLHGGISTGIAANAAGYAALTLMPPNSSVLGVEYKINLMEPGEGERFIARGRVVKPGRTLYIAEADVVAITRGIEKILSRMLTTMMCMQGVSDIRENKP